MPDVFSVLKQSLDSNASPEQQAFREAQIRQIESPSRRLGALALHKIALNHPLLSSWVLGLSPELRDLSYEDEGYHSLVYRKGCDQVVKINKHSLDVSEAERQAIASELARDYLMLQQYFGSQALEQTVSVEPHPISRQERAVLIRQPYFKHRRLICFIKDSSEVNLDGLRQDLEQAPGISQALTEMVEKSWSMYDSTYMLPDTRHPHNVVVSSDIPSSLKLIDSYLVKPQYPDAQSTIKHQLDSLANALSSAA